MKLKFTKDEYDTLVKVINILDKLSKKMVKEKRIICKQDYKQRHYLNDPYITSDRIECRSYGLQQLLDDDWVLVKADSYWKKPAIVK